MADRRSIGDVADLVRAKNAGPFWITFDIFLRNEDDYAIVGDSITPADVARVYGVEPTVVEIYRIPALHVIKISFPRRVSQGSFFDRDMHSGQQHIPLSDLPVPSAAAQLPI
jgi:Domain of unknown function (DUF4387)